jgi:Tol biopolymer transport system component
LAQSNPQLVWAHSPAISAGQYIVYASPSNLIPKDTNNVSDIYVQDTQDGSLERVSLASDGKQTRQASFQPVISTDGRYVAFTSLDDGLAAPYQEWDRNHLADIYLYDRQTKTSRRVSTTIRGADAEGWSHQPSLSADGRYLAYSSTATNIHVTDTTPDSDVFIFDAVDGDTVLASLNPAGDASLPAISADSRFVAYQVTEQAQDSIWLYDRVGNVAKALPRPATLGNAPISCPGISADGRFVAWVAGGPSAPDIYLLDRTTGETLLLPDPPILAKDRRRPQPPSLSADGNLLAIVVDTEGYILNRSSNRWDRLELDSGVGWVELALDGRSLVYAPPRGIQGLAVKLDRPARTAARPFLSGWIINGPGSPLAGIPINIGEGSMITTQPDGSFIFVNPPSEPVEIRPALPGFQFSPETRKILAEPGGAFALTFSATPVGVLEAAQKNIGMPYGLSRGCPSNYEPCGGPFSGYYRGDCTDLVMDAYLNGMEFDIQAALARDNQANPSHYYRWGDARNAQDMWRYFFYTGILQPAGGPYHLGDIVFFDWEFDGIVDHVALISDIARRGFPQKMLDATGVTQENPEGLAAELDWQSFHTTGAAGFVRWTGLPANAPQSPAPGVYFLAALDSPGARLRILDQQGAVLSSAEATIPGGVSISSGLGEVLSFPITQPVSNTYTLEITPLTADQVQLGVQIKTNGSIQYVDSLILPVKPGIQRLIPIIVGSTGLNLQLEK